MSFDTGGPLDSTLFSALEARIAALESNTVKVGDSSSTKQPQILAIRVPNAVVLTPGTTSEPFDIPYLVNSVPTAVFLQPAHSYSATSQYAHAQAYVIPSSVTKNGAKGAVYTPIIGGDKRPYQCVFYAIIICN
jgi:hypothetical protein